MSDTGNIERPSDTWTEPSLPLHGHRRVIGYVRVSSLSQVDGFGLDTQRDAIERLCALRGWDLVGFCSDEGVSGTNDVLDRPGFTCLVEWLEAGEADTVLIYDLSRLARALHVQEAGLGVLWQLGAEILTVDGDGAEVAKDDPEDPTRTLIRQVLGAVAEFQRRDLVRKLHAGKRTKREQTGGAGYVGGKIPLGWQVLGGGKSSAVAPLPEYVPVLAEIARGRREGATYRAIAEALNEAGAMGRSWHASAVLRLARQAERYGYTADSDA